MGVGYGGVVSKSFFTLEFGEGPSARHRNWMEVGYVLVVSESFVILEFGRDPSGVEVECGGIIFKQIQKLTADDFRS